MPTNDQLRFAAQRLERRMGYIKDNPRPDSRTEVNALRIAIDSLRASAAEQTEREIHDRTTLQI